jgi:hypothetical protein
MNSNELTGTWKFISLEIKTASGKTVHPFGENPFGLLIYTANGYMSYLCMDPARPKFKSDNLLGGTMEEISEAFKSFDAYSGTYTVDAEKGVVTHHVLGSKFPNWVGSEQVRHFRFSDNHLIIDADILVQGENSHFRGILERL